MPDDEAARLTAELSRSDPAADSGAERPAPERINLTPMMQQYLEAKAKVPGALLLFRMGDFYELFFDDAEEASRLLGLTLTSREKGENRIPMAGFPYHALEGHLSRLLQAGRRVAVCDQIEDPKLAAGLVKRDITRVVTAGTLTDETLLDPRSSNYLLAMLPEGPGRCVGLAWVDLSTGRMAAADVAPAEVADELARLEPSEFLVPENASVADDWLRLPRRPVVTRRPAWTFTPQNAHDLLSRHFGVATCSGFGFDDQAHCLSAAGAILSYLYETQKADLKHLARIEPYQRRGVMVLDPVTRRSLELVRTLRTNRREGTLLDTIDKTATAAGARLLAEWLTAPLVDPEAIRQRQSAVAEWKDDPAARQELRALLRRTYDVERLTARLSTGRTHPRDLAALRETFRWLPSVKARLAGRHAPFNAEIEAGIELFADLRGELEAALADDPPLPLREGGIIRAGYRAELDELRQIARGGKQWIAAFQKAEADRTGIANLKVGFNKVFGYYIEVSNSGRDKVPPDYHRKQTLKNAERYITPELKTYEEKVLTAEERSRNLEYELFCELRERVAQATGRLQQLAGALARLDVVLGLAELAAEHRYVRPSIVDSPELCIVGGRHPVVEVLLPAGRFVPNDTRLSASERVLLITGPNMAGKSTYIRQVALNVLLAQIGSFIPAESATIGVVDRIFTRVGASDELSRGQSTFMVEMTETANILHNATAQSLVILDEIGRGTSTYDGVSLAWAITEHLHDRSGCRTLFATHYHELIELEKTLPQLRNYNIAVREYKDEVVFLHQIVPGGADRSYGIHVAQLAGVPAEVLRRAEFVLDQLERDPFGETATRLGRPKKHRRAYHQLSLFPTTSEHPILDELRLVELDQLTSQQALEFLLAWRRRLAAED